MAKFSLGLLFFVVSTISIAAESASSVTETTVRNPWSPLQAAVDLSYSPLAYKDYEWLEGSTNQTKGHALRLAFEWIPLGDIPYGKPTVGVATGFNWIKKAELSGASADFYAIPIAPYIGYRFEYFANQLLIPYGKLGLNYTFTHQDTHFEDGKRVNEKPSMGFDYSLGVEICLNVFDQSSVRKLDGSTGINGVFLFAEYAKSRSLGAQWANLTHEEVQMGMRFEF